MIQDINIIDVVTGEIILNQDVLIDSGVIMKIISSGAAQIKAKTIIDGKEKVSNTRTMGYACSFTR